MLDGMQLRLPPNARALAAFMSQLSEQAYYATWMLGLEYELWQAVISGPRKYGRLRITSVHIAELRRLSDATAGWISFDAAEGPSLMAMQAWEKHFSERSGTSIRGS